LQLPKIAATVPRQGSSFFTDYLQRIRDCGGEPFELLPERRQDRAAWSGIAGLILPGGTDVDPSRYGAAPHPRTEMAKPELDELEIELAHRAHREGLPVLAICRGHQLLNVAFGGGLHQHIEGDGHRARDEEGHPSRWHDVRIEPDCRLAGLLGAGPHSVNSRHHQGVLPSTLAPALRPVAFSPDGFVEAMESVDGSWIVSVQWHPERDEMGAGSGALFEEFIRMARLQAGLAPAGAERPKVNNGQR
jgi:putative glutamine amidotransferase